MSEPWSATWQQATEPPPPEQGHAGAARSLSTRRIWIAIAGLGVVILAAGSVGFAFGRSSGERNAVEAAASASSSAAAASEAAKQTRLKEAYGGCKKSDAGNTMRLTDGGKTIVVDTRSEYGSTAGMDCVLKALGTSESITAQMDRTTAMMGVQDAEDDGIEYSWSYHPKNGVDMVITDTEASGN
jgi:hypothetical protein